jgi:hypothetical protein
MEQGAWSREPEDSGAGIKGEKNIHRRDPEYAEFGVLL